MPTDGCSASTARATSRRIGAGICWDHWFPEAAWALAHVARFDLDATRDLRRSWGLFRDRRPELYGALKDFG